MGSGNYPRWQSTIYPFHNAPSVGLNIIWYEVPETNPLVPTNCFSDRWWDVRAGFVRRGPGFDPGSFKIYRGAVPAAVFGPPKGTPEQWISGLDYNTYLAGGYNDNVVRPCFPARHDSYVIIAPGKATETVRSNRAWAVTAVAPGRATAPATTRSVYHNAAAGPGFATATGEATPPGLTAGSAHGTSTGDAPLQGTVVGDGRATAENTTP